MYEECMFQSVIRPLLFFFADSHFVQIDIRSFYVGTCTVIVQQCFGSILIFTLLMQSFYFLQSRIVQVKKRKDFAFQFLGITLAYETCDCKQNDVL